MSKRFRIVIECQTPEGSDDSRAHAYASNVCDYVRGPLFVEGIGYNLGITDVRYEMETECDHPIHTNPGLDVPCPQCEAETVVETLRRR